MFTSAGLSALLAHSARADQFVVTDVTYTHSGQTTSDSHYRVNPAAGSPTNWKSPVDYSMGSVHVRLEVKTKPGATPTKFQICFEGTPSYACTNQSQTYTTTGTYEWTTPFSAFYFGGEVDWSAGAKKVALILKDTENNKPQGDPLYVPTDLRVEVTVISKGASFIAPPRDAGVASDAGARDGGVRDAGTSDAGTSDAGRADAGGSGDAAPRDASMSNERDADSEPVQDARVAVDASARADAASGQDASEVGEEGEVESDDEGGGCSLGGVRGIGSGAWLALSLVLASRRRRQRPSR
jgi:hypothetical protein